MRCRFGEVVCRYRGVNHIPLGSFLWLKRRFIFARRLSMIADVFWLIGIAEAGAI